MAVTSTQTIRKSNTVATFCGLSHGSTQLIPEGGIIATPINPKGGSAKAIPYRGWLMTGQKADSGGLPGLLIQPPGIIIRGCDKTQGSKKNCAKIHGRISLKWQCFEVIR